MRTPNNSSLHAKPKSDKKTSHKADKLVAATSCGAANTVISKLNSCTALVFTALVAAEVRNDNRRPLSMNCDVGREIMSCGCGITDKVTQLRAASALIRQNISDVLYKP
jgi:hypothetical protein